VGFLTSRRPKTRFWTRLHNFLLYQRFRNKNLERDQVPDFCAEIHDFRVVFFWVRKSCFRAKSRLRPIYTSTDSLLSWKSRRPWGDRPDGASWTENPMDKTYFYGKGTTIDRKTVCDSNKKSVEVYLMSNFTFCTFVTVEGYPFLYRRTP